MYRAAIVTLSDSFGKFKTKIMEEDDVENCNLVEEDDELDNYNYKLFNDKI